MSVKFCPKCNDIMIKQFGIYGFYFYCKHCNYSVIDNKSLLNETEIVSPKGDIHKLEPDKWKLGIKKNNNIKSANIKVDIGDIK